jgi:CelD/BcsL family acetyltransferase involved in cellulose biosynthesis
MAQAAGFRVLAKEQTVCHTITLPETWQAYLGELSGNMRSTVERKTRKFMRECDGAVRQVADEDELAGIMTTFLDFQQQRWDPAYARRRELFNQFSRKLALAMLRAGRLDMSVLWAGATPVAIIWCFRFHTTVYFYLSAFDQDEQWNKYSVGTILLADSIRRAIEDGYHVFDLMRGNYGYKTRFASTPHQNYRVRIFRTALLQRGYQLGDRVRLLRGQLRRLAKQAGKRYLRRVNKLSDYAGRDSDQVHQPTLESPDRQEP